MSRRILVLFCLALLASSILPASARQDDLRQLYSTLASGHADFYNTVTAGEADDYVSQLADKVDSMNDAQYWYALSSVAALAHDSHTSLQLSVSTLASFSFIPVIFDSFDGTELTIVACDSQLSWLLGKKVVSVNGFSLDQILERARTVIPSDNDVHLLSVLKDNHLVFRDFYEELGIVREGEDIVLEFDDGCFFRLECQSLAQYSTSPKAYLMQKAVPTVNPSAYYSAMALADENALLINYHVCAEMEDYPFGQFAGQVLDLIRERGYGKIIVDLRYNSGGDSSVIGPLIDGLGTLMEEEELELYVLIGEDTFSSAVLNAIELRDRLGAVLVGRPTGGSASHYGELASGTLENSGLVFTWSTKYFDNGYSGPLMPDIPVERNVDDYINGVDSDLAALGVL